MEKKGEMRISLRLHFAMKLTEETHPTTEGRVISGSQPGVVLPSEGHLVRAGTSLVVTMEDKGAGHSCHAVVESRDRS